MMMFTMLAGIVSVLVDSPLGVHFKDIHFSFLFDEAVAAVVTGSPALVLK
jgi:hypothetical protein